MSDATGAALAGLCAISVLALLVAEHRSWRAGVWVAKPLASTAFVAAALAWGAASTAFGRFVLAGLLLCWLGDVLLIPRQRAGAFVAGIASFLLGHVAFGAGFAVRALDVAALLVGGVLVVPCAWGVLRWLRPHLSGPFRIAVPVYVVVICAMVVTAASTVLAAGRPTIAVGALAFAVSDVAVARDRLVSPGARSYLWGLPLYYAAQLLLASTVR